MTIKNLNTRLANAIIGTGVLQVLPFKTKKLALLCREVPGQGREWLAAVEQILVRVGQIDLPDTADVIIARRYMVKDGRLAFGWYVEVSAPTEEIRASIVWEFETALTGVRPSSQPRMMSSIAPKRATLDEEEEPAQAPRSSRPLAPGQRPKPVAKRKVPTSDDLTPSAAQLPPPGFSPTISLVSEGRDEKGQLVTIETMPLPHVYREQNQLSVKGRGAKLTGGGKA